MADSGALSRKQTAFVLALLEHSTVRDAARAAGIAERSGWRYLGLPSVRGALAQRQDAAMAQATTSIVGDMGAARQVLRDAMQDAHTPMGVRVRAAGLLLDCGLRLFELVALAQRVSDLERMVKDDPQNATR